MNYKELKQKRIDEINSRSKLSSIRSGKSSFFLALALVNLHTFSKPKGFLLESKILPEKVLNELKEELDKELHY